MLNKIILSIFLGVVTTLGVFAADDIVVGDGYSTKDNIIPAEEECIPDKTVCTQNSQCIENLECLQNQNTKNCYRCECNNGFEAIKGYCVKECEYGFTRNEKGVCVNLCNDDVSTCGKLVCDESVLPNRAVCIKNYSPKGGVLICDDYDLRGTCIIYNKSINFSELPFYPKSLKPFKGCREESWYGWEVYIPEGINGEYAENYMLYSDNEMINLNDEVINSELLREKIIIQPKNYDTFRDFYGSSVHYVEIGYCDANCDDGNPTTTHYRYKEVLLEGYYSTSSGHLFQLPTNMIKKINTYVYSNGENIDDEFFYPESFSNLLITENNNIDDGLLICNNILDSGGTIVDVDCRSLQYHAYYFDQTTKSSNWYFSTPSDPTTSFINNSNDLIYLNDDWEALVCPQVDSQLKDCKKIEQGVTYEKWRDIIGHDLLDVGNSAFKLFLIIQPSNRKKLEKVSGENYTILYADPNYSGNSIAYWKAGERYPNPIKQVRSIYNKGIYDTYLNKKKISEYTPFSTVKYSNVYSDRYLHTTDSTPWIFDNPENSDPTNSYWGYDSIILEYRHDILNEGLKLCIDKNLCQTFQGKVNISISGLTKFYIYPNWEAYICLDKDKTDCHYFKEGDRLKELKSFLGGGSINYMLIQPLTHQKMNQFYGHKEYNEQFDIFPKDELYPASGYLILYKNDSFKDCVPIECKVNSDCLSNNCKDGECKAELKPCTNGHDCKSNYCFYSFCKETLDPCVTIDDCPEIATCTNSGCKDYIKTCTSDSDCSTNICEYGICKARVTCDQKEIVFPTSDIIELGVDTLTNSDDLIKSIRSVGDIDYTLITNSGYIETPKNKYRQFHSGITLEKIIINKQKPTVVGVRANSFSESFGLGVVDNAPNSNKILYSNYESYGTVLTPNSSETDESFNQNRDMDNGDLLIISGHGAWMGDGPYQNILFRDDSFYQYKNFYGKSIGDYETEWMLISSCNSLGSKECDECYNSHNQYSGDVNCTNPNFICNSRGYVGNSDRLSCLNCTINGVNHQGSDCDGYKFCTHYRKTKEKEVLSFYSEFFVNGLHGIGGMYKRSFWPCSSDPVNKCGDIAEDFWNTIKRKKSIAYSYISSTGWESSTPGRNAGYIAPGPCYGDVFSYIHDDHFHGYGNVLPDPDRKFIKENGYCYYAFWDGLYNGTFGTNRDYDFTDINPSGDWNILIGEDFTLGLYNRLVSYFNKPDNISLFGKNGLSYTASNVEDNYVMIDNVGDRFELSDKIIDSYYQEANMFYDEVFQPMLKEYKVLSVKTSFIYNQHYNSEGDIDSKVYLNEIVFNFELGYNGHYFINNNFVQIGVNALTGEIISVKSKLLNVEEISEIILDSDINQYIDSLPKDDNLNYIKTYLLDENSGELRPAVISINLETTEFKILERY